MSLLLRHRLRLFATPVTSRQPLLTAVAVTVLRLQQQQQRPYASKKAKHKQQNHGQGSNNKNNNLDVDAEQLVGIGSASKRAPIATASLTPGSQQAVANPAAREELARAEAKMAASVEWLRREVAQLEARAGGRVTPRLLAPVRVAVVPSAGDRRGREDVTVSAMTNKVRLEELATVGVRDGSSLIVTVFDPQVSFFVPPLTPPLASCPRVTRAHLEK